MTKECVTCHSLWWWWVVFGNPYPMAEVVDSSYRLSVPFPAVASVGHLHGRWTLLLLIDWPDAVVLSRTTNQFKLSTTTPPHLGTPARPPPSLSFLGSLGWSSSLCDRHARLLLPALALRVRVCAALRAGVDR